LNKVIVSRNVQFDEERRIVAHTTTEHYKPPDLPYRPLTHSSDSSSTDTDRSDTSDDPPAPPPDTPDLSTENDQPDSDSASDCEDLPLSPTNPEDRLRTLRSWTKQTLVTSWNADTQYPFFCQLSCNGKIVFYLLPL